MDVLSHTTGLAFQDGVLMGTAGGFLVDWIVQRQLFTMYLNGSCIAFTPEHDLLKSIIDSSESYWPRPVRVYGYNSMDVVFGGDLFEAETNCDRALGQIASAHTNNLAFWSLVPFRDDQLPLVQPVSDPVVYDANTTYVCLVYGDMDNMYVLSFAAPHFCVSRSDSLAPRRCGCEPVVISFAVLVVIIWTRACRDVRVIQRRVSH